MVDTLHPSCHQEQSSFHAPRPTHCSAATPRDSKHNPRKQATRVCETCTFKNSSTCAYCDVCFFNRHPGLDILSKAEADAVRGGGGRGVGAKAWALSAAKKQDGWNHRRVCVVNDVTSKSWTAVLLFCVRVVLCPQKIVNVSAKERRAGGGGGCSGRVLI